MLPRPRPPTRARRAQLPRWTAWTIVGLLALALVAPAEASHRPPYLIRDSDGDLWLDAIEQLLGTSRYDADSDPVDLDGNCAAQSIPGTPAPDPTDPGNATNETDPAEPACPTPAPPLGPTDATDAINDTQLPINGTEDVPILNETEEPEIPEIPGGPEAPETPGLLDRNLGGPCDIEGWPNCPPEDDGSKPTGQNDAQRDNHHDNHTPPQDDGEAPEEDPDPVQEQLDETNETAEPVHNATKPVVEQVEATLNEETGLVEVTWLLGPEEEDESDAERYAIYRNNESEPAGETQHQQGQSNYTWPDRSHPEGNVTYTVVPIYNGANGTINGTGNSSEPEEFEPFPDEVGEEIRKCGPLDVDTDLDAICDNAETILGTNPWLIDSDGDGIPDPLALRLGLAGLDRNADPEGGDPPGSLSDPSPLASRAEPQSGEAAQTPLIVTGVLGLGASLMVSAIGALVRFRRP